MNILILTAVGGFLQEFLMHDVEMLMEQGHTLHYASNFDNPIYECDKDALEKLGARCFNIPIAKSPFSPKNIKALREIKKIITDWSIDLIYMHNPMGGVLGRLAASKKIITVYTPHGFHFYKGAPLLNRFFYYPAEKHLAHRTDVIITINHEDEEKAKTFHLKKGGFVDRIPGTGYDTERFYPDKSQKYILRDAYGIDRNDFIYLSVGELNNNKNHAVLITLTS